MDYDTDGLIGRAMQTDKSDLYRKIEDLERRVNELEKRLEEIGRSAVRKYEQGVGYR